MRAPGWTGAVTWIVCLMKAWRTWETRGLQPKCAWNTNPWVCMSLCKWSLDMSTDCTFTKCAAHKWISQVQLKFSWKLPVAGVQVWGLRRCLVESRSWIWKRASKPVDAWRRLRNLTRWLFEGGCLLLIFWGRCLKGMLALFKAT